MFSKGNAGKKHVDYVAGDGGQAAALSFVRNN